MLSLQSVHKPFGGRVLYTGVGLRIEQGAAGGWVEGPVAASVAARGAVDPAQFHSYCETMKNITVSVDDETYRRARITAAEQGRSVSAMVRDYLANLVASKRVEPSRQCSCVPMRAGYTAGRHNIGLENYRAGTGTDPAGTSG